MSLPGLRGKKKKGKGGGRKGRTREHKTDKRPSGYVSRAKKKKREREKRGRGGKKIEECSGSSHNYYLHQGKK